MDRLIHPFDPVYDGQSRLLILGSFPSVLSREHGFYYGNPRNRFWPLLSVAFNEPVPQDNAGRRDYLLRHRLALWDVYASCRIRGSSDISIREARPNDLAALLNTAPIERILANGQEAGKACQRVLGPSWLERLVILPSTSPANAAYSLERLLDAWRPWLSIYNPADGC